MKERRLRRFEELIRAKIASVLLRDLQDPHLGFVTITKVKVDKELLYCDVFWSALGDGRQQSVQKRLLDRAAGFVQREVAQILETRTVPHVRFVFDESIQGAMRIDGMIKKLKQEREEREANQAPPPSPTSPEADEKPPAS